VASVRYKLADLVTAPTDEVLGRLAHLYADLGFHSLLTSAIDAWKDQLPILQSALRELATARPDALTWNVLLEYVLPMRDRRPDVVILAGKCVFVIEFKVGAKTFDSAALWQVQSYALDLRDFHPGCRDRSIVPILVATEAEGDQFSERDLQTQLREPSTPVQRASRTTLGPCLRHHAIVGCQSSEHDIDPDDWDSAIYSPTPSIIEAARSLFAGHRVEEISHAFSDTLELTSQSIVEAIERSQSQGRRAICFVTGIPGSGKTLVGLNAVHSPALLKDEGSSAVFLSGNGPLVKVIREALAREQQRRGVQKSEAKDVASAFIANVHGFLKVFGIQQPDRAPAQNAVVFDEAQRAWSADAVRRAHGIDRSEPALILDVMERVPDWAAVIALVGGGQEINKGEAGLQEWGRALNERKERWQILVSPEVLSGGESVAGNRLFPTGAPEHLDVVHVPQLHLRVNVRSHRAGFIGEWVNRVLSDSQAASCGELGADFPVVFTRDLSRARAWLVERQEQRQRIGLLASSGAMRLRGYGLELSSAFRKGISYPDWFLNAIGDVRSSYQLEIAATEFDCQGLEIDWAGVCWGGDFVIDPSSGKWDHWRFSGSKWQRVSNAVKRQYAINKYRVLLTRARRGMVIWIPSGPAAAKDAKFLDATAAHLQRAGVEELT
jgi:hypothetical protein